MAQRLKQNFNEVQAILDAVGQKVDKVEGKGLSANDYTDQDKNKLASVEEDAQENVIEVIESDGVELPIENKTVRIPAHKQSDWSQNDSSGKDYIKNRTHWEENGVVHKLHPKFLDMDTAPTSGSTKPVTSGGVKEALDGKQDVISDIADIRHGAGLGETAYQKPSAGIPASDLAAGVIPDVSGFITRTVNDLANYYLKSETYTKAEVAALIGAIRQFHYEVYAALPTTGEGNVLYLIGPTGSGSDKYEEYVYANNGWVKIGDTSIDLSGYATTQALNQAVAGLGTAIEGKEDVSNKVTSLSSSSTDTQYPSAKAVYDALEDKQDTINTVNVTVDNNTGTPSATASVSNDTLNIAFHNIKGATGAIGPQGNTGSSVDYPYELVNNLTTDDATKGLSAAQGKVLGDKVDTLAPALKTASGDFVTFDDAAAGTRLSSAVADIDYNAEGVTNATVRATGKNLFGGDALRTQILTEVSGSSAPAEGQARWKSTSSGSIIPNLGWKENTVYTIILTLYRSTGSTEGTSYPANALVYYTDGSTERVTYRSAGSGVFVTIAMKTSASKTFDRVSAANHGGNTTVDCAHSGVFEGDVDLEDFEIYAEEAHVIDWSEVAGTIYGGSLDLTNGKLTSTLAADGTELETPVEYDITPRTIYVREGWNSIRADTGEMAVRYTLNLDKLYVSKDNLDELMEYEIDLEAFAPVWAFPGASNKWVSNRPNYPYYGKFIPVDPGQMIALIAQDGQAAGYTFLQNDSHTYNDWVAYASGYSGAPVKTQETRTTVIAPNNARFMYISVSIDGLVSYIGPESVRVVAKNVEEIAYGVVNRVDNEGGIPAGLTKIAYDGPLVVAEKQHHVATSKVATITSVACQGGACFGDYLFLFAEGNATCWIYNLAESALVQTIAIPTEERGFVENCHANTVNFGRRYYDANDPFPLIYVSTGYSADGYTGALVYRIIVEGEEDSTTYSLALVQTLRMPSTTEDGVWTEFVIGEDDDCYICYTTSRRIFRMRLPSLADGDVIFDLADALAIYQFTPQPNWFNGSRNQNRFYSGGKMYVISGVPAATPTAASERSLFMVLNLSTESREVVINLQDLGLNSEPEANFIWNGHHCIAFRNQAGVYALYFE